MILYRIWTFGTFLEPFRHSRFNIDPYGQNIRFHISYDSHTSRWLFSQFSLKLPVKIYDIVRKDVHTNILVYRTYTCMLMILVYHRLTCDLTWYNEVHALYECPWDYPHMPPDYRHLDQYPGLVMDILCSKLEGNESRSKAKRFSRKSSEKRTTLTIHDQATSWSSVLMLVKY